MFHDHKVPFFHFSHALDAPLLGQDFTDFPANIYQERTSQNIDKTQLYTLFERLNHTPMYMRAIIQNMIINPALTLEKATENRIDGLNTHQAEAGTW